MHAVNDERNKEMKKGTRDGPLRGGKGGCSAGTQRATEQLMKKKKHHGKVFGKRRLVSEEGGGFG